jgi:predicted O-linked N-acetylglucosamine transferase (SPINDLY family)
VRPVSPELRLLMASARVYGAEEAIIREILEPGIDWTDFARKALDHGVACICGSTLARIAPDLVPEDVRDAFWISIERMRTRNQAAFDELVELNEALKRNGVDAIALKGPVLAIQAFGDLGLREFGRCDLLVRESDAALASAAVPAAKKAGGVGANVRTGLTSGQVTLDIGYAELRRRAMRTDLNGHLLLTLAPEDILLVLAIHGTEGMWWRIKSPCDVAAFIGSHPDLDWKATIARARGMGCLPMLVLALSLARRYFGSRVPLAAAEGANSMIDSVVERIVGDWQQDTTPRRAEAFSADLLRLHNGAARRGRYVARTVFLPRWRSRVSRPVQRQLEYLPIRIGRLLGKPGAWIEYAQRLFDAKRYGEAVEATDHALRIDPANVRAKRLGVYARLWSCDWRRLQDDKRWLFDCIEAHSQAIRPSFLELFDFDAAQLERIAMEQTPASRQARLPEPLWRGERYQHPEIRVAYISTDCSSDPGATLTTGIFEHHDKQHFDVTAVSLGRDRRTPMRERIEAASRRFIQADKMSNAEVAATLRDLRVDIAVDLNGPLGERNTAVLAFRLAPVQVHYSGYPGTLALPYMDYIVADRIVIPEGHQRRFSEQVVYLPHSYQPNDCNRPTAEETPSRSEVDLPVTGFVFACFNNNYKITPTIFGIWMRLLQLVDNSVLWLLEDNASATVNLRREAQMRGIDPGRLVFAPRLPSHRNLARQRLADLFLDTLPTNAHATASDALWVGLPILTCIGEIFRSRVAASLLHAVGLPELVTASLAEYEQLALALARDPPRLNAIKAKLIRNRSTAPLFDTPRYTRYLEAAYTVMWQRSRMGLPPAAFAVDA